MQKKIMIPVIACMLSASCLAAPVYASEDSNSDISFESLVQNFKTQRDNYGKIGDENVDVGYQAYLNNVATSSTLLADKLEDFNNYNYKNIDTYKKMEDIYQKSLQSQEDVSKATLESYEKAKKEAQETTNQAQEEANQAFNEFSSQMSALKSEIANTKSSVTAKSQAAAVKRYSSGSSGYNTVMSKIKSGKTVNYYKDSGFYDLYNKERVKMDTTYTGNNEGSMDITTSATTNINSLVSNFGISNTIKNTVNILKNKSR